MERQSEWFTPLRVYSKWSKILTATYVLFVDFRNCKEAKQIKEKLVDKINVYWQDIDKQRIKPDKKGKPAVVAHKTINRDMSPEAQDNIQPNGQPGDIFLNDSFRQENGSLQKSSKSPIQAVNVSRSPYEDIGLRDLPNKISDIRRGERFNESIKKESLAVVKKSQVPTNNAMPLKETKPVNPLSKSTVIKTINSGRKIEPVKKQLTRDKSPLAVNGAKSPLSKSPLTSSFKDKLGIKNVKTMK